MGIAALSEALLVYIHVWMAGLNWSRAEVIAERHGVKQAMGALAEALSYDQRRWTSGIFTVGLLLIAALATLGATLTSDRMPRS